MPWAGIEPASSGPQPDVLPLYYHGGYELPEADSRVFEISHFIEILEKVRNYLWKI